VTIVPSHQILGNFDLKRGRDGSSHSTWLQRQPQRPQREGMWAAVGPRACMIVIFSRKPESFHSQAVQLHRHPLGVQGDTLHPRRQWQAPCHQASGPSRILSRNGVLGVWLSSLKMQQRCAKNMSIYPSVAPTPLMSLLDTMYSIIPPLAEILRCDVPEQSFCFTGFARTPEEIRK